MYINCGNSILLDFCQAVYCSVSAYKWHMLEEWYWNIYIYTHILHMYIHVYVLRLYAALPSHNQLYTFKVIGFAATRYATLRLPRSLLLALPLPPAPAPLTTIRRYFMIATNCFCHTFCMFQFNLLNAFAYIHIEIYILYICIYISISVCLSLWVAIYLVRFCSDS